MYKEKLLPLKCTSTKMESRKNLLLSWA